MLKILEHFKLGLQSRYPPCCIAHFCLDILLGRTPGQQRRAVILRSHDSAYVPCRFHRKYGVITIKADGELVDLTPWIERLGAV